MLNFNAITRQTAAGSLESSSTAADAHRYLSANTPALQCPAGSCWVHASTSPRSPASDTFCAKDSQRPSREANTTIFCSTTPARMIGWTTCSSGCQKAWASLILVQLIVESWKVRFGRDLLIWVRKLPHEDSSSLMGCKFAVTPDS